MARAVRKGSGLAGKMDMPSPAHASLNLLKQHAQVICLIAGSYLNCHSQLLAETSVREAPALEISPASSDSRLDHVEQSLQTLIEENSRLSAEIQELRERQEVWPYTQPTADPGEAQAFGQPSAGRLATQDGFFADYDGGIIIRPRQPSQNPFSLKVNHQNTFRYAAFDPDASFWIDSSGTLRPINSSSDFSIPRGRLILSGQTLKENLSYLLNIDYNTVTNNPIGFRAFVLSYRIRRALEVHVGQNKVPGSREWLHSSFDAQEGPDRSMATTFFRPSLSQGIWFTGELSDSLRYHSMLSNGFNTLNVRSGDLDDRFCGSTSVWWEPWGSFGRGYSDIEYHQQAAIRLGSCLSSTREEGSQTSDYPENTLVRLSDGTLITQQGALAPGITLQAFGLSLVAIDLSYKYRGLSLSTEIYRQELSSFRGTGPLPLDALQTYGGMAQGGYFVRPREIECYTRNSFVTGAFGSGTEIGAGFNWFLLPGSSRLRYTLDLAWLDSSPADQNRTGFVAGQSGYLIRTQITSAF
jgi:hypothetical protein